MDTGSHLLFGATLAGLAMLSPVVSTEPQLAEAVLTATLIGSHAPDLDTFARLKGYSVYIRIHRGFTHSLPALVLWPLLLAFPIAWLFDVMAYWPLLIAWTFAAVFFHVFLDWFNAYGVQCFRPWSKKWHHLDVLTLFEPALFGLHAAGILMWCFTEVQPGPMFAWIYAASMLYIGLRTVQHHYMIRYVQKQLQLEGTCHVVPSLHWFRWQFVLETERFFYTGVLQGLTIRVKDVYAKDASNDMMIEAAKAADGVGAFLQFAQRIHVKCREQQDGYVVEWRDVRFWHNHKLPFGVDVELDRNLNVVSSRLGWSKKAWDPPFV